MSLLLSYAAGALVAFSPCVLPALPLIAAGATAQHKLGPLAAAAGLVVSFTVFGVTLAAIGPAIGLDAQTLRTVGAVALILVGAVLLVPPLSAWVEGLFKPLGAKAGEAVSGKVFSGLSGQFALGAALGAVWAPCTGPVLAAAVALAAQAGGLAPAAGQMFVFGLGAATPLLLAAYGSRALMAKLRAGAAKAAFAKPAMGAIIAALGVLTLTGLDAALQDALTAALPAWWLEAITAL
jgi:cytochrome c biogenesis protein CcdA